MEPVLAMIATAALVVGFVVLVWAITRGSHRLLGVESLLDGAVRRCAACAHKSVCDTGALAGWTGDGAACPNLRRLQERKPL